MGFHSKCRHNDCLNKLHRRVNSTRTHELFLGGSALAAPIKDFSGRTVAVMDILTPEHRYMPEHREGCIGLLLKGAERASARLGHRADAHGSSATKRRPQSASAAR